MSELIKTSLIEILDFSNFIDMTTSLILIKSCDKILLVTTWKKTVIS